MSSNFRGRVLRPYELGHGGNAGYSTGSLRSSLPRGVPNSCMDLRPREVVGQLELEVEMPLPYRRLDGQIFQRSVVISVPQVLTTGHTHVRLQIALPRRCPRNCERRTVSAVALLARISWPLVRKVQIESRSMAIWGCMCSTVGYNVEAGEE